MSKIGDALAFGVGGLGGVLGYERVRSIKAQSDRTKGYINDAYATATQRMGAAQSQGSEGNLEAMNARGMLGGGVTPIRAALASGRTQGATDLASASQSRLFGEYALDRHVLNAEHQRDLNDNKLNTTNAYIGLGTNAIKQAASVFTGTEGLAGASGPMSAATPSASMTPIRSAILSGSSWEGVHPNDPLNDPSSSWHTPSVSIDGDGMHNSSFNSLGVG